MNHPTPLLIGATAAQQQLGISPQQLTKLIGCNLLNDHALPGARNKRLDADAVRKLAKWKTFRPVSNEPVVAVHLGPATLVSEPAERNEKLARRAKGFTKGNPLGLSQLDLERAWLGWWPISPKIADAAIGGILVGDVAGFIPRGLGRRISSWQPSDDGGSIRFVAEELTTEEMKQVTKRRFRASRGNIWEILN